MLLDLAGVIAAPPQSTTGTVVRVRALPGGTTALIVRSLTGGRVTMIIAVAIDPECARLSVAGLSRILAMRLDLTLTTAAGTVTGIGGRRVRLRRIPPSAVLALAASGVRTTVRFSL